VFRKKFDPKTLSWRHSFRTALQHGVFPNRAVLGVIDMAFASYLSAKGEKSLDEAFGLTSVQRSGNPSAVQADEDLKGRCFMAMLDARRAHKDATIQEWAEYVIKTLEARPPFGAETLARYFGDWCREYDMDLTLDDEPAP
jgi:hypothetical protein